jgi:FkbM family methyltransferase
MAAAVFRADGLLWSSGGPDSDDHLGYAPHEEVLEPTFRELLGADRVFLDVGAHVGRWSVRLAGQARQVIAVEANPETAAVLSENIRLNGIGNITVLQVAAWDGHTTLRLEDPNGRERGGSTRVLETGGGPLVPAAPLDDALPPGQEVGFVKLDVEGADLRALRGMQATLARERPVMLIERHDLYGYYQVGELYAVLAELGYRWRDAPSYEGASYLIAEPE